jgi:excisionase family DNA binding protein
MRKIRNSNPGKVSLMNIKQVTAWLSISERTLHRYIDTGKLRAYKLDGLVLFNPADIEAFLHRRMIGGGPVVGPQDKLDFDISEYQILSDEEAQTFVRNAKKIDGAVVGVTGDPEEDSWIVEK